MSLNKYLTDLASAMVLTAEEKESIKISKDTLNSRLKLYFENKQDLNYIYTFGSYIRETILPRKVDENSDVDILIEFKNISSYSPQTCLNWLKGFAETKYSTSEIYQSSPTIVLNLNHIKFELVPSYRDWSYYIPGKDGNWMNTDPTGFKERLEEANKNNSYLIKPLIRLMKYWNVNKCYHSFASYELESKIINNFRYGSYNCVNLYDYVQESFETIDSVMLSQTTRNKIESAKSYLKQAKEEESNGYPVTALGTLKKVFSEV